MIQKNNCPPVSKQTGVKMNYAFLHHIEYK
jgi:hypothetical protein